MPKKHTIRLGKMLRRLARIRGGGSALPGLLVEKIEPQFLKEALSQLPQGVVLISGTNGKTTTTKMVAELLEAAGLKVFTNRTGSNFTRGVVSALIEVIGKDGTLPYDIAVLELDEAHAVHFVKQVSPRVSLFLNIMRDQLDRFGEIDHTAKLLAIVAKHTTETVVLNRDDPLIRNLVHSVEKGVEVRYFGAHGTILHLFPSDEQLKLATERVVQDAGKPSSPAKAHKDDVELAAFKNQKVAFCVQDKVYEAELRLSGFYNFLNAAAALAVVRLFRPKTSVKTLVSVLEKVEPAFGRGERVMFHKKPVEFILVKNPAGFRLALASAKQEEGETATMIAINDNFADGRDMSWLWDVNFGSLRAGGVQMVSGVRAYDMALRLQYDNVTVGKVDADLLKAFKGLLAHNAGKSMRIYCTYTAMLRLRSAAAKQLNMEPAL